MLRLQRLSTAALLMAGLAVASLMDAPLTLEAQQMPSMDAATQTSTSTTPVRTAASRRTATCPCATRKRRVVRKRVVRRRRRVVRTRPVIAAEPLPEVLPETKIPETKVQPAVQQAPAPAETTLYPPMQYPAVPATSDSPRYLPGSGQPLPQPAPVQPAPRVAAPSYAAPKVPAEKWHHPVRMLHEDGSPKISAEFGGGVTLPVAQAQKSQTQGGAIEGALGYNFNRYFTIQARGEFDRGGLPVAVLTAQNQEKGRVEMISGTANLIVRYAVIGRFGGYVTGGGGYYQRSTIFTASSGGSDDVETARYTMETLGGNFGTGVEWKLMPRAGLKLFVEARYVFLEGQSQSGATGYTLNSRTTEYVPALIGFRW